MKNATAFLLNFHIFVLIRPASPLNGAVVQQTQQSDALTFVRYHAMMRKTFAKAAAKGKELSMEENKKTAGENTPAPKKKITSKQVVAIIGIVLLVLMYVATLIVAVFDSSASGRLFWMCLFSTVAIPLLIWIYTWMYGKLTRKHTFADFDLGGTKERADSTSETGTRE